MIQTKPLIEYVAEYAVKQLKGKSPDDICAFYVQKMILTNIGTLKQLIEYYHLPEHDMVKMHRKLEVIINNGSNGRNA